MTDDRQPGYDYFPPATPRAPEPPTGPQTNSYAGPNGAPPIGGSFRGVQVSPQLSYGQSLPAQRPSLPVWLIVLIAAGASVILIGILAAIAIPVFLSQRMKAQWHNTTVSLPASVNGVKRNTTPKALALAKTFASEEIPAEDVAIYGTVGPKAVILLAVKQPTAMSSPQLDAERVTFEKSFTSRGSSLSLRQDPNPDKLGGWLGCGTTPDGVNVCLATDVGSLVAVVLGPDAGDPVTLTRLARDETVTRH